ncbi:type II toxin-antitoxin system prevent-host-death family antitoxin [Thermoleophilia bacterium SCSIO 60948]|nr:type II toxin-antitoxin system prevent-host-death family antitoxin [Thermoleophilia bacterium SCSIO 60948]
MAEVRGSSPLSSILAEPADRLEVSAHDFRDRFGFYLEQASAGREVLVLRHGRPAARLSSAAALATSPDRV